MFTDRDSHPYYSSVALSSLFSGVYMLGDGGHRLMEIFFPECDSDDLRAAEQMVDLCVKVPINSNQRDALISFCESITPEEFKKSDILKAINRKRSLSGVMSCASLLNDYTASEDEFGRLKTDNELISRRNEEMALFLAPELKLVGGRDVQ